MLVGFAGLARAGKDTCAELAVSILASRGISARIVKLAAPLRSAMGVLGVDRTKDPDVYRKFAQILGEGLRQHDHDHWIKLFNAQVMTNMAAGIVSVCSDVRYPNEVDCIHQHAGLLYYVNAGTRINMDDPVYYHPSEKLAVILQTDLNLGKTLPPGWDGNIKNRGPLQSDSLNKQIMYFLTRDFAFSTQGAKIA